MLSRDQLANVTPFKAAPTFLGVFRAQEDHDQLRLGSIELGEKDVKVESRKVCFVKFIVEHSRLSEFASQEFSDFQNKASPLSRKRERDFESFLIFFQTIVLRRPQNAVVFLASTSNCPPNPLFPYGTEKVTWTRQILSRTGAQSCPNLCTVRFKNQISRIPWLSHSKIARFRQSFKKNRPPFIVTIRFWVVALPTKIQSLLKGKSNWGDQSAAHVMN